MGDAAIRAMGRWSSSAHLHYTFLSILDLQASATEMARAAHLSRDRPAIFVGDFNGASVFRDISRDA